MRNQRLGFDSRARAFALALWCLALGCMVVPTVGFPTATIQFTSLNYTFAVVKLTFDQPTRISWFNLTEGNLYNVTGCRQVGDTAVLFAGFSNPLLPANTFYTEGAAFEAVFKLTADYATIEVKPRVAVDFNYDTNPLSSELVVDYTRGHHVNGLEIWGHQVPFGGDVCVRPDDVEPINIDESEVRGYLTHASLEEHPSMFVPPYFKGI
eukprot:1190403-Prorocentrum_minimum.AAC.7